MDIHLIALATEQAVEHAAEAESAGVVGTLGLNWKLFLAQIVNFAVILLILWKWVFRPLAGALESRRKKIEDSIAKAELIEKQMAEADKTREQNLREARAEAEKIIQNTALEAEKARQIALAAAKGEAERVLARAKETIEAEKILMLKEVKDEIAGLVVLATEKILLEKLDEKKDKQLINTVLKDLSS